MNLIYTSQFKRDYKRIVSQGKEIQKLEIVIDLLLGSQKLEARYRDHPLIGKWENHRDCHLEPDWVLIYRLTEDSLILERTGSHSDLFR